MYVIGKPLKFLRVEGLVLFATSIYAFHSTHQQWWWVPALLFVPDVFMIGYARGPALGAWTYNLGHSYPLPALPFLYGWHTHRPLVLAIGLIWFAHIGMDRLLGYGLKYDDNFKHTHLGSLVKK